MDKETVRDRQIVERYLQGRLGADEERAFEEAYLSDPELLDELVLTEKLKAGLARTGVSAAPSGGPRPPARDGWQRVFASVPYAAAATVLLALSLTLSALLLVQNRSLEPGVTAPAPAPTRLVPLVTVRGNAAPNRIEAPPAGEWAVLLADAGFTDYAAYRATLTRRDDDVSETVAELDGLAPTYDGRVGLGVPGGALTPGDYELSLEGRVAEGRYEPITRIPLTVTAQP